MIHSTDIYLTRKLKWQIFGRCRRNQSEIQNIAAIKPPRVVKTVRNNLFLSLSDEELFDYVKFKLNDIHLPEFRDSRDLQCGFQMVYMI